MNLAAFQTLIKQALSLQEDLAEADEKKFDSFDHWLENLNVVVRSTAMSEFEIADRIREIVKEHPYSSGSYAQWAVAVLGGYQELLTDLGLIGFWIIPICENDQWVDGLCLGTPAGCITHIPDPWDASERVTEEDIQHVAQFFLEAAVDFGVYRCTETVTP
jgi:hypothetical protein